MHEFEKDFHERATEVDSISNVMSEIAARVGTDNFVGRVALGASFARIESLKFSNKIHSVITAAYFKSKSEFQNMSDIFGPFRYDNLETIELYANTARLAEIPKDHENFVPKYTWKSKTHDTETCYGYWD